MPKATDIVTATIIEAETCGVCHIIFGMTREFRRARMADKKTFRCPNGCSINYAGESASDKAQRLAGELDREKTRNANLLHENAVATKQLDYARRAQKNISTRMKKIKHRVAHGVCPCCHRTFKQLQQHMQSQHPTYVNKTDDDHAQTS